ncbi:MAG: hypothetical protein E7662_09840, partial [Ruminococcaceae bacterium]|nr:hypothetical protein [Oscillospiraceae bacterium]
MKGDAMKRFVGLFISVALLLQMLLVPSFSGDAADSGVNFTLSAARSGDTLEVSVTVSGDASYNSMALYNLNYDKAYLTFTGFSGNEDILNKVRFPAASFMEDGDITLAFTKAETLNGQICRMHFDIAADIPCGTYTVSGTPLVKNSSAVIASSVAAGSFTVPHVPEYMAAVAATCTTGGS